MMDIDLAEAAQYLTDGGSDGGFDAAYIVEAQDLQLNVVLFQSKYSRKLDQDSNFPANAVEKAVNTIKCVFDPSARIELNMQSRKKVEPDGNLWRRTAGEKYPPLSGKKCC